MRSLLTIATIIFAVAGLLAQTRGQTADDPVRTLVNRLDLERY